jgi:ABC-type cobalt transport system substrate-binding protein
MMMVMIIIIIIIINMLVKFIFTHCGRNTGGECSRKGC